jgi:hypothetical protein
VKTEKLKNNIVLGSLTRPPPHAILEEDNSVIYNPERYGNKMILDVVRRKGSSGTINVTWVATSQSNTEMPFAVSPMFSELTFIEGQWNSSIHLKFGAMPNMSEAVLNVKFLKMSGGAILGNVTSLKIVFPAKVKEIEDSDSNVILEIIIPCAAGVLVILVVMAACILVRKRQR